MEQFDVVVIGSGPGGYIAAVRASQLGFKTAIIERYKTLGGTCLNVGRIPSKAWLDSSERYHETVHSHEVHGIDVGSVKLNPKKMSERVAKVVSDITGGVAFLMKKIRLQSLMVTDLLKIRQLFLLSRRLRLKKSVVNILLSLLVLNLLHYRISLLIKSVSLHRQKP